MVLVPREQFSQNVQRVSLEIEDILHVDAADGERRDLCQESSCMHVYRAL